MSKQSDVVVKLDDRIRLMSAVLAATDFPEKSQKHKPHGTHAHARATSKYLAAFDKHPAVAATQTLLDQNTPLEALFALVMFMDWPQLSIATLPHWAPPGYNELLHDFYVTSKLHEWWEQENSLWDKSLHQAQNVFRDVEFLPFLVPFLGKIDAELMFIPNISYPTDYDVGFQLGNAMVCISPPPLAWGDSPPWPYDESTMFTYSYRAAMTVYGRILLLNYLRSHEATLKEITKNELPVTDQFKAQHPSWEDQFSALFLSAVVAMYLESHVDEKEYRAYMLMEKKARGMSLLPGTVSVLRRYLQEVGNNKYTNLIEFLPIFPRQLRVARKIVTF